MLAIKVKTKSDFRKVEKAAKKANFTSLGHAAASIRRAAIKSIRKGKRASKAGQPPRTRRGLFKKAILFDVNKDKQVAVIGPSHEIAGTSGQAHEFGGKYKGQTFPERPFMAPAFQGEVPRFAGRWQGTIGA